MTQDRLLIRIARRAYDAVHAFHDARDAGVKQALASLVSRLEQIRLATRKLGICDQREFRAATAIVTERTRYVLYDLQSDLQVALRKIDEAGSTKEPLSCRDMLAEVLALKREFSDIRYNGAERYVAVTTEPIVLEGVILGRFEIRLLLDRLGEGGAGQALWIVALDPNPAATNESVTHPHVSDEVLCAGDASAALQNAIAAGRLCDVFQLVNSVLNTYNEESPYVPLDKWEGRPCYGCGWLVDEDESYWCESCENDFCDDCFSSCAACSESSCKGCLNRCPLCEEPVCNNCMNACSACGQGACDRCLEEGLCPSCIEQEEESDESEDEQIDEDQTKTQPEEARRPPLAAVATSPAIHPGGLGETDVLLPSR